MLTQEHKHHPVLTKANGQAVNKFMHQNKYTRKCAQIPIFEMIMILPIFMSELLINNAVDRFCMHAKSCPIIKNKSIDH